MGWLFKLYARIELVKLGMVIQSHLFICIGFLGVEATCKLTGRVIHAYTPGLFYFVNENGFGFLYHFSLSVRVYK